MPIVVCDAGPLIHLDEPENGDSCSGTRNAFRYRWIRDELGCLDLLSDFSEVLVPEAVWREVRQHRPDDFAFFLPIPLPLSRPSGCIHAVFLAHAQGARLCQSEKSVVSSHPTAQRS
jgi:hypothetical protein